jgi:hypothetical protein
MTSMFKQYELMERNFRTIKIVTQKFYDAFRKR